MPPARSPPPACATPGSALSPTSGSPAWTPTPKTRSSLPAARPPGHASSPPPSGRPTKALSAARARVEHGFSDLKHWRILTRLRINPVNYAHGHPPGRAPPTPPTPAPLTSQFRLERPHWPYLRFHRPNLAQAGVPCQNSRIGTDLVFRAR